jgi:hypothetical protein
VITVVPSGDLAGKLASESFAKVSFHLPFCALKVVGVRNQFIGGRVGFTSKFASGGACNTNRMIVHIYGELGTIDGVGS